ncbi:hypothetical protein CAC42_6301 [Sphaceloma murrayae]|uniref:Impact N-terminal domain-containing protein n=1 Tax=Sphaceloma murrayae TaxID=2082308 RepID=A0A2K1QTU2_9PEZI|nr:hypothetical protein CAC42_6301 [Sphaceloma murrayae]
MASARYGYTTVSPRDNPSKPIPSLPSATGKRARSSSPTTSSDDQLFTSDPLHDRQSTFTGYFSPSLAPHDLQSLATLASASHRVLAYRVPISAPLSSTKKSRQSTLGFVSNGSSGKKEALQTGQDDDGEQYAAKHVARVLADMNVVGSLVVARWYGGVLLGPVRFAHIEKVAREAVQAYLDAQRGGGGGKAGNGGSGPVGAAGAGTGESLGEERKRLIPELEERDTSIASLRKLLDQKKGILASLEGTEGITSERASQSSPTKKMEYSKLPIERLRLLDQARDKTIGFLLKQIDGVEEKIVALNDADEGHE